MPHHLTPGGGMSDTKLNLVAGEWVSGESEVENRSPSDLSDLVGLFAQASPDQLDATLEQAHRAQLEWAAYGLERKQAVLMAVGNELMSRAEELGTLLSREEGKPLAEGRGEVYRGPVFYVLRCRVPASDRRKRRQRAGWYRDRRTPRACRHGRCHFSLELPADTGHEPHCSSVSCR